MSNCSYVVGQLGWVNLILRLRICYVCWYCCLLCDLGILLTSWCMREWLLIGVINLYFTCFDGLWFRCWWLLTLYCCFAFCLDILVIWVFTSLQLVVLLTWLDFALVWLSAIADLVDCFCVAGRFIWITVCGRLCFTVLILFA